MSVPAPGSFRAAFHTAVDSIERIFPTAADALGWLEIQCPGAEFEFDVRTEKWSARDGCGYLIGAVDRQQAG